jgi:peptidoglycan/xylan/chitin deacetylase (PgdA/CDA1 family)
MSGDPIDSSQYWPEGYRSGVMLSYDLDAGETWRCLAMEEPEWDKPLIRTRGRYGPKEAVPRLLHILDKYDVKSTFFIPGKVLEAYPETAGAIHDAGHEIGHHGYTHRTPLSMDGPEEEEAEIKKGLDAFDDILGIRPVGYRTPFYEISNHTLDILADNGFTYHSTFIDSDLPYIHEQGIVELPVDFSLEDWLYFGYNFVPAFPFHGGFMPADQVLQWYIREFRGVHKYGRFFSILHHPQLEGRPGRIAMTEELIEEILSAGTSWITTGENIATHWLDHHEIEDPPDITSWDS